jgi:putative choline sulfate-utilization transcription factor
MPRRFPGLPRLHLLATFEVAGRHLNFSAAAQELGTTQPAVSQQIGQLEADLGTVLFHRFHRGVALTVAGAELFAAVGDGLAVINEASLSIRRRTGPKVLQVLTDFGFAAWWLMPRLGTLSKRMPDVDVKILTSQHGNDLRREEADIGILFGRHDQWPGCRTSLLFPEVVCPVAAREFVPDGATLDPGGLSQLRLLHLKQPFPDCWLSWPDWFAAKGVAMGKRSHDLTFNNYQLLLQAALLQQGVALGWRPLIDEMLRGGQLVRLAEDYHGVSRGYHVVEPNIRVEDPMVTDFRDWLMEERDKGIPFEG